jgi:hypothetical protein
MAFSRPSQSQAAYFCQIETTVLTTPSAASRRLKSVEGIEATAGG